MGDSLICQSHVEQRILDYTTFMGEDYLPRQYFVRLTLHAPSIHSNFIKNIPQFHMENNLPWAAHLLSVTVLTE